jgi:hypothetical protein
LTADTTAIPSGNKISDPYEHSLNSISSSAMQWELLINRVDEYFIRNGWFDKLP